MTSLENIEDVYKFESKIIGKRVIILKDQEISGQSELRD
jgi:hypothetical protein